MIYSIQFFTHILEVQLLTEWYFQVSTSEKRLQQENTIKVGN